MGCPERSLFKNWKGRGEGEDPRKDGKETETLSSSARSEKMERVGDR